MNYYHPISDDTLFTERLQTLLRRHLSELQAFAAREDRAAEEIYEQVAGWYSQYMFGDSQGTSKSTGVDVVHHTLRRVSNMLDALETTAGLQSFFLAVNPKKDNDQGFLGGTQLGRDFWRRYKAGGAPGAHAFKAHCATRLGPQWYAEASNNLRMTPYVLPTPAQTTLSQKGPAGAIKAEVYTAMRVAVREASGNHEAEMKWSKHSNLSMYGIRLEGWPDDVPKQNPSSLNMAQNKAILDALKSGTLRFVRLESSREEQSSSQSTSPDAAATSEPYDIPAFSVDNQGTDFDIPWDFQAPGVMATADDLSALFESSSFTTQSDPSLTVQEPINSEATSDFVNELMNSFAQIAGSTSVENPPTSKKRRLEETIDSTVDSCHLFWDL
ncbi:hypothetical protein K474DRAFT_1660007 [Panus rudis PR-1116 ss-1]|nr:hypothetical protein K474DRAFT_1660007 [Panus rudis PR-1116 ss-1]